MGHKQKSNGTAVAKAPSTNPLGHDGASGPLWATECELHPLGGRVTSGKAGSSAEGRGTGLCAVSRQGF